MSKKLAAAIIVILAVILAGAAAYVLWNEDSDNTQTISFDSNGGSSVAALNQKSGTQITAPAAPVKNGSDFVGWYSDQNLTVPFEFDVMPDKNITLYAKWSVVLTDEQRNEIISSGSEEWSAESSASASLHDLEELYDAGVQTIVLNSSAGKISIKISSLMEAIYDSEIIQNSQHSGGILLSDDIPTSAASAVVTVSFSPLSLSILSSEFADAVGGRPVYEFLILVNGTAVDFENTLLVISMEYVPAEGEDTSNLYACAVAETYIYAGSPLLYENGTLFLEVPGNRFAIVEGGISCPDMFGLNLPKPADRVHWYLEGSFMQLLSKEISDEDLAELSKYINLSVLDLQIRTAQAVGDFDEEYYISYISELKSSGVKEHGTFGGSETQYWLGSISAGGTDYLVVAGFYDYYLGSELTLSIVPLNIIKELGITFSTVGTDVWYDSLAGIVMPELHPDVNADIWIDVKLDGSDLSKFLNRLIVTDNLDSKSASMLKKLISMFDKADGDYGIAGISGADLSKTDIDMFIQGLADENNLQLVYMPTDEQSGTAIITGTFEMMNGRYVHEKSIIVSWNIDEDLQSSVYIIVANAPMSFTADGIPGLEMNMKYFSNWDITLSDVEFSAPFEGAVIGYYTDISVSKELLHDIADILSSMDTSGETGSAADALRSLGDISVSIISSSGAGYTYETVSNWVSSIAENNGYTLLYSGEELWTMAKMSSSIPGEIESVCTIYWMPYEYLGESCGSLHITIMGMPQTL